MQISSIQSLPEGFTTDRAGTPQPETIQDRSRQEHVRQLAQAAKAVNQSGQLGPDREFTIILDRETGQPVIRLIDRQTREVMRTKVTIAIADPPRQGMDDLQPDFDAAFAVFLFLAITSKKIELSNDVITYYDIRTDDNVSFLDNEK